ncbi:MAG: hypothetical protein WC821_01995 [archaeon]|jgi:UPF0288 family protein (methanogenesis marker protein 3)
MLGKTVFGKKLLFLAVLCILFAANVNAMDCNNITLLTGSYDGNIDLNLSCNKSISGGLLEVFSADSIKMGSVSNVACGPTQSSVNISDLALKENQNYKVVLTIPGSCGVLSKQVVITTTKEKAQSFIPDGNTFVVLILFLGLLLILNKPFKKN